MKNIFIFLFIIISMGILTVSASGQMTLGQYEDEAPLGSWNISSGLSFVYARDATAAVTNPALINQRPALSAAVNGFFNNTSLNKFALINTGILTARENPAFNVYGIDSGAVAIRIKQWGFSLSSGILEIYNRPAITAEYKSQGTVQQRITFEQEGFLRSTNLSLCRTFGNWMTAGIGFNLISGELDRKYEDYYAYYDGLIISDTRSQTFTGFFLTGGIFAEISPVISMAAVLRMPYDKKAEGESSYRYHIASAGTDIQINSAEDSLYRQPLMAGAGIKFSITREFLAAVDMAFFNWSQYEVNYFGTEHKRDFKDTLKAGLGVEYTGKMKLFGREFDIPVWAGFQYDPQPMRDPDSFYTVLIFGSGIQTGRFFLHMSSHIGSEHGSGDNLQTRNAALTLGYEIK